MADIVFDQKAIVNRAPFDALIGEDFVNFIFDHAPRKVTTRVAKAADHAAKAEKLKGLDEEMGFIRLVAAEEELVVAIFEWLKLHPDIYPEHKDFVSKFKNHAVKLTFYPVLVQFRWILGGMLEDGLTLDGLEGLFSMRAEPIIEGYTIRLLIKHEDGTELLRHDPLHIVISADGLDGPAVVPALFAELELILMDQRGQGVKAFVQDRADLRNKLLYASDAGSVELGDTFDALLDQFHQAYHDLLWVLLVLMGGKPLSKKWGIVAQFIELYRQVLVTAGIIKKDGTVQTPESEWSRSIGVHVLMSRVENGDPGGSQPGPHVEPLSPLRNIRKQGKVKPPTMCRGWMHGYVAVGV